MEAAQRERDEARRKTKRLTLMRYMVMSNSALLPSWEICHRDTAWLARPSPPRGLTTLRGGLVPLPSRKSAQQASDA